METVIFNGRPDGIGNRIEQAIFLQEYCMCKKLFCIFLWDNRQFRKFDHTYIEFKNLRFTDSVTEDEYKNFRTINQFIAGFERSIVFRPVYEIKLKGKIDAAPYDICVHIRATDRLKKNSSGDFSTPEELNKIIIRAANLVSTRDDISTYSVVSDDKNYIDLFNGRVKNKKYITVSRNSKNDKSWEDYSILTSADKFILMACKFSSYSITAALLSDMPIFLPEESKETCISRYNLRKSVMY